MKIVEIETGKARNQGRQIVADEIGAGGTLWLGPCMSETLGIEPGKEYTLIAIPKGKTAGRIRLVQPPDLDGAEPRWVLHQREPKGAGVEVTMTTGDAVTNLQVDGDEAEVRLGSTTILFRTVSMVAAALRESFGSPGPAEPEQTEERGEGRVVEIGEGEMLVMTGDGVPVINGPCSVTITRQLKVEGEKS